MDGGADVAVPACFLCYCLFWPVGLGPFYGLQYVAHPTLRNFVLPSLLLVVVAVGLWMWAVRSRPVARAIPWLVLPLLPVLNIQVFGNGNFAHNRYLYLPSVGFCLLAAAALKGLKWRQLGIALRTLYPIGQIGVGLALAVLMGYAIQAGRSLLCRRRRLLFVRLRADGRRRPGDRHGLCQHLGRAGDYARAGQVYLRLIQAHPDMWDAYFNLGYMYYQPGI